MSHASQQLLSPGASPISIAMAMMEMVGRTEAALARDSAPTHRASLINRRLLEDGVMFNLAEASGPHYLADAHSQSTEGGEMRFPAWPRQWASNRHGSMHGGFVTATMDALAAAHLFTLISGPNVGYNAVTVHLSVDFLAPVPLTTSEEDRRHFSSVVGASNYHPEGVVFHTRLEQLGRRTARFSAWVTQMRPQEKSSGVLPTGLQQRVLASGRITKLFQGRRNVVVPPITSSSHL